MEFDITLPIAGMTLNPLFILGLGLVGGFLSGMLGVGGGVIITPVLMIFGIPPVVAIASQVNHSIGTCLTGFLNYHRNNDVDYKLGIFLLSGGLSGAIGGIYFLRWIQKHGYTDMVITFSYIIVLGLMGVLLFRQSLKALAESRLPFKTATPPKWTSHFLFKVYFARTRVELSILFPFLAGVLNGLLTSSIGMGNGVVMMPAVTYLIGRTSPVVYGTTLLAGLGIATSVTLLYAVGTQSVDLVLVFLLLSGGVIGSQLGVRFGYTLPRPYLGILGATLILTICLRFSLDLQPVFARTELLPLTTPQNLTGVMRFVLDFANSYPILYGVCGIIWAMLFAGVVEFIFARFSLNSKKTRD